MYVRTSSTRRNSGLSGLGDAQQDRVQSEVTAAAQKYGVDPQLALLIAQHESAYQQINPKTGTTIQSTLANGQPGALGVMQLMPATAAGLGVNPYDEQQNIDGGVRLLSQLLKQFNGNVTNAVAAYSAGPGAVQKYGGVPPYAETQNYVQWINARYSGSGSASDSSGSPSTSDTPSTSSSLFDLSSLFPSLPSSDTQYDIGGLVLSGQDLIVIGGIALAAVLVSAML